MSDKQDTSKKLDTGFLGENSRALWTVLGGIAGVVTLIGGAAGGLYSYLQSDDIPPPIPPSSSSSASTATPTVTSPEPPPSSPTANSPTPDPALSVLSELADGTHEIESEGIFGSVRPNGNDCTSVGRQRYQYAFVAANKQSYPEEGAPYRSYIDISLDPGTIFLDGTIGAVDCSKPRRKVHATLLVDGQKKWEGDAVLGKTHPIHIDVSGASQVRFEVKGESNGAWAAFADPTGLG